MYKTSKKKLTKKYALLKAENICSRQEKCEEDIRRKLIEWDVDEGDRDEIINMLIKNSFIDNSRFAKAFVREKSSISKWGKIKIEFALKQKKINNELIKIALEEIDNTKYDKILEKELIAKLKSIKNQDIYTIKSKLVRFGISRGYENGKIFDMLNKILKELNSDELL